MGSVRARIPFLSRVAVMRMLQGSEATSCTTRRTEALTARRHKLRRAFFLGRVKLGECDTVLRILRAADGLAVDGEFKLHWLRLQHQILILVEHKSRAVTTFGVSAGTRDGRARNAIDCTGPAVTKNVALFPSSETT